MIEMVLVRTCEGIVVDVALWSFGGAASLHVPRNYLVSRYLCRS